MTDHSQYCAACEIEIGGPCRACLGIEPGRPACGCVDPDTSCDVCFEEAFPGLADALTTTVQVDAALNVHSEAWEAAARYERELIVRIIEDFPEHDPDLILRSDLLAAIRKEATND